MTAAVFRVISSWFSLEDRSAFMISGCFLEKKASERLEVRLDDSVLEYGLRILDDSESRFLLNAVGSKSAEQYLLNIQLPADWTSYKKLLIYTAPRGGQAPCLQTALSVKDMIRQSKRVECCFDVVEFEQDAVLIRGWAMSIQPIEIQVRDAAGEALPYELQWLARRDVSAACREKQASAHPGFVITLGNAAAKKKITVIVTSGDQTSEAVFKLQALHRKGQYQHSIAGQRMKRVLNGYYLRKAALYIRRYGWRRFVKKVLDRLSGKASGDLQYSEWRKARLLTQGQIEEQRAARFAYSPRFSIVVPLYKTPLNYLRMLVESVQEQTYANWELCLSDGSGKDSPLQEYLMELSVREKRVRIFRSDVPLQISENTNVAIRGASGEFIVFADHDDLLAPDALYECVKALNKNPDIDVIYSDEDKISFDGKEFFQPHFKPDFNIDLLRSMNYICHLYVVRRSLLDQVGLLRSVFDGAQDYDFILRSCEQAREICHIPRVLYHWRAHRDSTAENPESKRYAFDAGKRAIQAHYDRLGIPATVEMHEFALGMYRTVYHWEEKPLVSVIIPNKDHTEDLDTCVRSIIERATYRNFEFIIVENNSTELKTFEYYKRLESQYPFVKVVYYKGDFNFSAINNFGAAYASGDYYLLLNNDTEIINNNFLEEMLGYCMRDDVGIVGARLFYQDDTIQHAGVIVGLGGIAGHTFVGFPKDSNGYFSRILCAQDLSAVTAACLMVKKKAFEEAGGMSTELKVAFNDIDFCLRVRRCGYLVVYNPEVMLHHYESKSRGYEDTPEKVERFNHEIAVFQQHWPDILRQGDPYYNRNLDLFCVDFSLRQRTESGMQVDLREW